MQEEKGFEKTSKITLEGSTINKQFQYWLMALPSVGKVNAAILRL